MRITRLALSLAVLVAACVPAVTQDRKPLPRGEQSQYVVSAKSGVVSVVDGSATLKRRQVQLLANAATTQVVEGDELGTGDTVITAADARIEILLNPGCFLRVNENSEVSYLTEDLVLAQHIKLTRGSAIVEAAALDDVMTVITPKSKFRINQLGLYRFDVQADGTAQVAVHKGRVNMDSVVVKSGRTASDAQASPLVAKLDGKVSDSFDTWSKDRAKTLIASNRSLSNRTLKNTLAGGGLGNSWVYDPFCRCYTFLPYTYGFSSPYGWGYSRYNPYWWSMWPNYGGGTYAGGPNGNGSPGNGSSGGGQSSGGNRGGNWSPVEGGGSRGGGGSVSPPRTGGDGGRGAGGGGWSRDPGGRETPAPVSGGGARKP